MTRAAARFRSLIELQDEAVLILDHQGVVTYASDSAQRIFGCTAAELVGLALSHLLSERYQFKCRRLLAELDPEPIGLRRLGSRGQAVGRRHNGQEFPAIVSVLKLGRPKTPQYVVLLHDITAAAAMIQELQDRIDEQARAAEAGSLVQRLLEESHSYDPPTL